MPYQTHELNIASAEIHSALCSAAKTFSYFSLLETGSALINSPEVLDKYDFLAAGGSVNTFSYSDATSNAWKELKNNWRSSPTWWFGILSYDLKNALEKTSFSRHPQNPNFPEIIFFEPEWVVISEKGIIKLYTHKTRNIEAYSWWDGILVRGLEGLKKNDGVKLKDSLTINDYLKKANQMKSWIDYGDIYEANLCVPYYGFGKVEPMCVYKDLQLKAEAPMAGYFQIPSTILISASPERYLSLRKDKHEINIYSQPIKGTAARSENLEKDLTSANDLLNSEKERSENTMIVDLVRNDISRVSKQRSVKVNRYLELRKLPTVYHLVSTIQGVIKDDLDWISAIEATFPMGSMTGAPKIRAMERIDSLETARRGWYSGALGYVTPEGECDFNVIIRSLLFEKQDHKWTSWAGSALTIDSDSKKEWDEINLKIDAPKRALDFNN